MRFALLLAHACVAIVSIPVVATEPDTDALVAKAVQAAGGEEKLLKLFRIKEQLSVGSNPDKKGKVRVSVIEPPDYWWIGEKQRDEDEPARYLAWAWTLAAVTDPESKLEVLPEIVEADKPAYGLRVSGTVTPPMDLYFDKGEGRLLRIDWKSSVHRLSDWKESDGVSYPSKCVGYKRKTNQPWYFSEIVELQRLEELPEGLSR